MSTESNTSNSAGALFLSGNTGRFGTAGIGWGVKGGLGVEGAKVGLIGC